MKDARSVLAFRLQQRLCHDVHAVHVGAGNYATAHFLIRSGR
jgi:hypothetical protein